MRRETSARFATAAVVLMTTALAIADVEAGRGTSLGRFDPARDLYLAQFDSRTDVDDLHSVAGVATMLRDPLFAGVRHHAVAGAYGIQEGPYVPAPELFDLAFGGHWSDAHGNREQAVSTVSALVGRTLATGGHVWVAEAGQSDFTADWLARVNEAYPAAVTGARVHVVQHSDWNESVTSPGKLAYVRANADYRRIPDGNDTGNGTPGFRLASGHLWQRLPATGDTGEIWRAARALAREFNGRDGRYDNAAIAAGGMDFSDVVETCWIFGRDGLHDADAFFTEFIGP